MNGSNRIPTVVLSLVKDTGAKTRFFNLESIDSSRRETLLTYQRIIAPGSVLVGAIVSEKEWDVRPVLLSKGVMTVTRLFSPELCESVSLRDQFKSYIFNVERLFPATQNFVCGSSEGYSWVTRRYFNTLLSDGGIEIPLTDRPKIILELLKDIAKLHKEGLLHGHIHPNNIAIVEGRCILLDHGFHINDIGASHPTTIAPELRESAQIAHNAVEPASDLYGIGLIAKRLFGGELQVEHGNLIEVLLLQDPKLRPALDQIISHFKVEEGAQVNELSGSNTSLKRGKFFSFKLSKNWIGLILVAFLSVVVLGLVFKYTLSYIRFNHVSKVEDSMAKLWDSSQTQLMQQVVRLALQGNGDAINFLKDRLQTQKSHPAIQQKLFTIAFHPFWVDELSDEDIKALLVFGMPSLVPASLRQAPDLTTLHPAVPFAIAASISVSDGFAPFKGISTNRLGTLPETYGSAFLALSKLGVKDLSSADTQSLAHILTLDFSDQNISHFLLLGNPAEESLARLEVLRPLFDSIPKLADSVVSTVNRQQDNPLSWFAKDVVAGWDQRPSIEKVSLLLGTMPVGLSFEQLIDLLRFPRNGIREIARTQLLQQVGDSYKGVIDYLSSNDSPLTRTQAISLLATFLVPSDKSRSFALQWFDTNPDPTSVLTLLVLRPISKGDDPFNIAAARYLLNKDIPLTKDQITVLLKHTESLVRALAYSKLPATTVQEKSELTKFLSSETDEGLKSRQLERLKD